MTLDEATVIYSLQRVNGWDGEAGWEEEDYKLVIELGKKLGLNAGLNIESDSYVYASAIWLLMRRNTGLEDEAGTGDEVLQLVDIFSRHLRRKQK